MSQGLFFLSTIPLLVTALWAAPAVTVYEGVTDLPSFLFFSKREVIKKIGQHIKISSPTHTHCFYGFKPRRRMSNCKQTKHSLPRLSVIKVDTVFSLMEFSRKFYEDCNETSQDCTVTVVQIYEHFYWENINIPSKVSVCRARDPAEESRWSRVLKAFASHKGKSFPKLFLRILLRMFVFLGAEGGGARGSMRGCCVPQQHPAALFPLQEGIAPWQSFTINHSYLHPALWFPRLRRAGNPAKTTRLSWTEGKHLEMFTRSDCSWFCSFLDKNPSPLSWKCGTEPWPAWTSTNQAIQEKRAPGRP